MKHYKWYLFLVFVYFLSTDLALYKLLRVKLGIVDSYLLDQFWPLFLLAFAYIYQTYRGFVRMKVKHVLYFAISVSLTSLLLKDLLGSYFIKSDYASTLGFITKPESLENSYLLKNFFYYYFFSIFTLLYRFFKLKVIFYNAFSLLMVGISSVIIYILLIKIGEIKKQKNHLSALLFTLVFIFSTVYMEAYLYIQLSVIVGFLSGGVALLLYNYFSFLANPKKQAYFTLAYLIYLTLMKTMFVRVGFLPLLLILAELLHFSKFRSNIKTLAFRLFLLITPFLLLLNSLLGKNGSNFYGVGIKNNILNIDRIYLLFSNILPSISPNQFYSRAYYLILNNRNNQLLSSTSFYYNIFFYLGVLLFAIFTAISIWLYVSKKEKLTIFFWFGYISSLSFSIFFGNVEKAPYQNSYDLQYIKYASFPGSRYYVLPYLFALTMFYLLVKYLILKARGRKHILLSTFVLSVLAISAYSSLRMTQRLFKEANVQQRELRIITENVLRMVPDDNEVKVVYSTDGPIKSVENLGFGGFEIGSLYENTAPEYIRSESELIAYLDKYNLKRENIFAFSFQNNKFEEKSEQVRNKFFTQF